MTLWICIPVHGRLALTRRCLDSLRAQRYRDFRVVVCDDGSPDETVGTLAQQYPEVVLLQGDGNLWWTGAINWCVRYALEHGAAADAVVTLNNDLEVQPDYLEELAAVSRRHPGSLVASAAHDIRTGALHDPGWRQVWALATSRRLDPSRDHLPGEPDVARVTHASGRGTLVPVSVFRAVGLYDERRLPHYGADYEFSFRAARYGVPCLISYRARVFSHVQETGLETVLHGEGSPRLLTYLTSRRSPANLSVRFWLAIRSCPRGLLPLYLCMDFARVIGGYARRRLAS